MSRKWMVTMILLLVAATCSASDFCVWTLADSDSIVGRVGYRLGENIEAGIESTWNTDSGKPGQFWGLFGIYQAQEAIDFDKIFANDWIPNLVGTPYCGVSMSIDFDSQNDKRTVVGPIAGIILEDLLVVEWMYAFVSDNMDNYLDDEYRLRIGLHIEF